MAKFKIGDRARFVSPGDVAHNQECNIISVGFVCNDGKIDDYGIKFINSSFDHPYDITWGCPEFKLEPITKLGSWNELENSIGWNPTKQEKRDEKANTGVIPDTTSVS